MPRKRDPDGVREGPGRPSLGADARSERVQVRVTSALRARIAAAASREGKSESEWGEAAFERVLARGDSAQVAALKARVADLERELEQARGVVAAVAAALDLNASAA